MNTLNKFSKSDSTYFIGTQETSQNRFLKLRPRIIFPITIIVGTITIATMSNWPLFNNCLFNQCLCDVISIQRQISL